MRVKRTLVGILFIFSLWLVGTTNLPAQCPMCKMSAESNLRNGGTAGKGLNRGILFLFFTPYILVGTLGYIWWRNSKKRSGEEDLA